MGNAFLCRPLVPTAYNASNETAAGPASNAFNDRLGRVWQGAPTGGVLIVLIDFGALIEVDTLALLATNANAGDIVHWEASTLAIGSFDSAAYYGPDLPIPASAEGAQRPHRQSLEKLATPVLARSWACRITTTAPLFSIGRIVIGKAWSPEDTFDFGWEMGVTDRGSTETSDAGMKNARRGTKHMQYRWTWGWETPDEARSQGLELGIYAGTTRPVLFCADPEAPDLHNVIGFGTLSEGPRFQQIAVEGYTSSHQLDSDLILSL